MGLKTIIGGLRLRWKFALVCGAVSAITAIGINLDRAIQYEQTPGFGTGVLSAAGIIGISIGWRFMRRAAISQEKLPLLVAIGLATAGAAELAHSIDEFGSYQQWWSLQAPRPQLVSHLVLGLFLVASAFSSGKRISNNVAERASQIMLAAVFSGLLMEIGWRYTGSPARAITLITAAFLGGSGILLVEQFRKDKDQATWSLAISLLFNVAALTMLALMDTPSGLGGDLAVLMVMMAYVSPVLGLGASASHRLEEAEEDLIIMRSLEDRFHGVVEHGSYPILSINEKGRVDYANGAAVSLLRYESEQLVGLAARDLLTTSSEALTDPRPTRDEPISLRAEFQIKRDDGILIKAEVAMSSVLIRGHRLTTWVIRDLSAQNRAAEALNYQATHDELTDLLNRKAVVELLSKELNSRRSSDDNIAVLFLDLDRFKVVNDRHGHDAGDELLRQTARRMLQAVRSNDIVARLGGDEFIVLCRDFNDIADVIAVAERIIESLSKRFNLDDCEAFVSASVGLAISDGNSLSAGELIDQADSALYRAKERGRSRWELFDESMQAWADSQEELNAALADAISDGELELWYQPIVNILEDRLLGFEALVRWRRPDGEILQPGLFVEAAEASGLIVPLGRWVLDTVARQIVAWDAKFPDNNLYVATNVSGRQLMESDGVELLIGDVRGAGVDPSRITLELTETVLLDDTDSALKVLNRLKEAGFRIAIDDFGTGYSSLTYLRKFPIDIVKIDRSFVTPLFHSEDDATIVATIIALANALKLTVVAEGIEDRETAARLLGLRCKVGQGYYFGKPGEVREVERNHLASLLSKR